MANIFFKKNFSRLNWNSLQMICKMLEKIAIVIVLDQQAVASGVVLLAGVAGKGGLKKMDVMVHLVGMPSTLVY